jgi:hypothetical protein
MNIQNIWLKGNSIKKLDNLNVIQFAIIAEEWKLDARFVVMKVKICVINYAHQNIIRNTFELWKIVSTFCQGWYKEESRQQGRRNNIG